MRRIFSSSFFSHQEEFLGQSYFFLNIKSVERMPWISREIYFDCRLVIGINSLLSIKHIKNIVYTKSDMHMWLQKWIIKLLIIDKFTTFHHISKVHVRNFNNKKRKKETIMAEIARENTHEKSSSLVKL